MKHHHISKKLPLKIKVFVLKYVCEECEKEHEITTTFKVEKIPDCYICESCLMEMRKEYENN